MTAQAKPLPHFMNWDLWNSKNYLKGIDYSLGDKLAVNLDLGSVKINNAAELTPQEVNENSFEARFLQKLLSTWWETSNFGYKINGATRHSITEYFANKNLLIFGAAPFAGMGHMIEEALKLQLLMSATGVKSWIVQPEEFMTGIHALLFGAKAKIHELMQHDDLSPENFDEVFRNIINTSQHFRETLMANVAKVTAQVAIAVSPEGEGKDQVTQIARNARERIDSIPPMANWLMRFIVYMDSNLTESQLGKIVKDLTDQVIVQGYEIALLDTSHPFVFRSLASLVRGKKIEGKIQMLIPDRGFMRKIKDKGTELSIEDNFMLEIFAQLTGNSKAVTLTPSSEITQSLREIFLNKGPIVQTGELLDSLTPAELNIKWNSLEKRNVALMVNGNASNAGTIRRAVLEFLDYIENRNNVKSGYFQSYNLAVCLFAHKLEKIFPQKAQLARVQKALEDHKDYLRIIQTENKVQAAHLSRHIPRWAHIRIGKPPGENAFMSAAVGCLEVCGFSQMINEQNNMLYNTDKALISKYPPGSVKKWSPILRHLTKEAKAQAETGFNFHADRFVHYLNALFNKDFAKNFTINGYLRSEHLNTLHNLMVSIAQMAEGELKTDTQDEILQYMAVAQEKFYESLFSEMHTHFGFSREETLARMKNKFLKDIQPADFDLPNKYMQSYESQVVARKQQRAIDRRNRLLTAGIFTVCMGVVSYQIFKALKSTPPSKNF